MGTSRGLQTPSPIPRAAGAAVARTAPCAVDTTRETREYPSASPMGREASLASTAGGPGGALIASRPPARVLASLGDPSHARGVCRAPIPREKIRYLSAELLIVTILVIGLVWLCVANDLQGVSVSNEKVLAIDPCAPRKPNSTGKFRGLTKRDHGRWLPGGVSPSSSAAVFIRRALTARQTAGLVMLPRSPPCTHGRGP